MKLNLKGVFTLDIDEKTIENSPDKSQKRQEKLDELREKCPWDRKQTNESLRPQTLEEVYELSDAILKGEERELSKELGDVLLQVAVRYAFCLIRQMGSKANFLPFLQVCHIAP